MARLSEGTTAIIKLGNEEVKFTLREPTNKELNEFMAERYSVDRKNRMKDRSLAARINFFDLLLTEVENLDDRDGTPITVDKKGSIPANWKNDIIFQTFEQVEIDIKN